MYIRSLHISQLRCFREARLDFQHPQRADGVAALPNMNLLLGNNGAGKTTVLKAIALATLAPVLEGSGLVPYRLVRRTRTEQATRADVSADVLLHAQDLGVRNRAATSEETVRLGVERIRDEERLDCPRAVDHWESMFDEQSPAFLVVGYGAGRRVESSSTYDQGARLKSRRLRYQRVAGLFEDQVTLTPLGAWLPRLRSENPGRYKQVVTLINRLLPEECRFTDEMEAGNLLFELRGAPVPFPALSDGYRAYIGWLSDLLYHIWLGVPSGAKLVETRGIVLVDEIDLHLHPEWQRTVVPRVAAALPNLQFVLTTHSPIVAGTLESGHIFVTELDEDGQAVARQLQERIHGLSAEQILLGAYFNLETTRAPAMEDELSTLIREARTGDTEAAVAYLRRLGEGSRREEAAAPTAKRSS
jgi:predicted ATPase